MALLHCLQGQAIMPSILGPVAVGVLGTFGLWERSFLDSWYALTKHASPSARCMYISFWLL
ncbi:hypothetical protein BDV19DRAFT_352403 [Aspergillus venezuelensis]